MATTDRLAASGLHALDAGRTGRRNLRKIFSEVRRKGVSAALHDLSLKAVNAVVLFKILRGVFIERFDPAFLISPERYTPLFLPAETIRNFARDPENGMPEDFLAEALSKGDECFGFLDGERLAAYGWYSFTPTRIDPADLLLRFGGDYVYMYKGFTHPRYRGQRLHAIGMTMALREYLSKGRKGLVSYVESNNFDSLKSCHRMGYAEFGSVYVMKLLGRYFTYSSRGCRRFGFRVEPIPLRPAGLDRLTGRRVPRSPGR